MDLNPLLKLQGDMFVSLLQRGRGMSYLTPPLQVCVGVVSLTSAVLVAQVREPPNVSEADSKAHAGHDEVHLSGPCFPLLVSWSRPGDHASHFVLSSTSTTCHATTGHRCQRDEAAICGCWWETVTAPIRKEEGLLLGLLQERAGGGRQSLLLHHSQNRNGSGTGQEPVRNGSGTRQEPVGNESGTGQEPVGNGSGMGQERVRNGSGTSR